MFLVDKINTDSLLEMQPVFILGMLYFIKSLIVKVLFDVLVQVVYVASNTI